MEPITEYLKQKNLLGFVNESFGSEKINAVFHNERGHLDSDFKYFINKEMLWDKITDDDIEEMETEDARKLAYKKDSNAYIIWLDPQGKYIGRTAGNYSIVINYNMRGLVRNTVKALSIASDKAIVISDPDKFSTSAIRKLRTEQKKNATALMSDVEIKKQNLKRYQDTINNNRLSEINMGDIAESVKTVLDKYATMVAGLTGELAASNDYKSIIEKLDDMDDEISKIVSWFKEILKRKEDYDKYKKWEAIAADYRDRMLNAVDSLSKDIDKFNQKYGE